MDQSFFVELIENKNTDIKKALIFCAVCHTIICEKNDKGFQNFLKTIFFYP
jgi:hypothetical protein